MIWPAAAGVLGAGAGLLGWAVRGRSCQWLAPSVWRGPSGRRAVALTFDDGPSESTGRVLDLLQRHGATATFFQIGQNVERLPNVAREVVSAGCEVANHSYSHPRFDFTSAEFQYNELSRTQQVIRQACGVTPAWFRAPYGVRWFGMAEAQKRCGLTGAMWTLIARDWRLDATAIEKRALGSVSSGAILCFHDGRALARDPGIAPTLDALEKILPALSAQGWEMVTLSRLMK